MNEALETIELEWGVTVEIHSDPEPLNPRKEWDHYTTMVCSHDRYELGDRQVKFSDFEDGADFEQWVENNYGKPAIIKPLWLYDHSGITMRIGESNPFSDRWDSGLVGYIFATQAQVDEVGVDAETLIKGEVEEYDQYLTGDVYGFMVKRDDEIEESCWGFFGQKDAEDEGKAVGECVVAEVVKAMTDEDNEHRHPYITEES